MLDLSAAAVRVCARCGTELPPRALVCPACALFVHRERLQELADLAARADTAGDVDAARAHWHEALDLVPVQSQQYAAISARLARLIPAAESRGHTATARDGSTWWKGAIGAAAAAGLFVVTKFKLLALGLTKVSTLFSMFGFVGVYWSLYGWPLAAGMAGSIYVHEMGHVAMLRRLGIRADAPLFIPGVGAFVMLRQHLSDRIADARIGIAGPVWGLGAAIAAVAIYFATGARIWLAIAELTAFLNLFNLTPIWQLDGARAFQVFTRIERWAIVATIAVALAATGVKILWIVGAVAVFQAVRQPDGPGHRATLVTFATVVIALAWIARDVQ